MVLSLTLSVFGSRLQGQICDDLIPAVTGFPFIVEWCINKAELIKGCDALEVSLTINNTDDDPVTGIGVTLSAFEGFSMYQNPDNFATGSPTVFPYGSGSVTLNTYLLSGINVPPTTSKTLRILFKTNPSIAGGTVFPDINFQMRLSMTFNNTIYTKISPPDYLTAIGSVVGNPNQDKTLTQAIADLELIPSAQSQNSGQKVIIRGTLRVNEDYWFPHSEVFLDKDANIIVESGKNLSFTGNPTTYILGCTDMWTGIVVENGAYLVIDQSIVSDGIEAIQPRHGSTISITKSHFRNNRIAVSNKFSPPSQNIDAFIFQNTFESTQLKPPYSGQKGFAGISIKETNDFGATECNFLNLDNGIISYRTNFGAYSNYFQDITRSDPYNSNMNAGYAIRGILGKGSQVLNVHGLGKSDVNPSFKNCTEGVSSVGHFLWVGNNGMLQVHRGITGAFGLKVTMVDNLIKAYETGISLNQNSDYLYAPHLIQGNDLYINGDNNIGTGIRGYEHTLIGWGYHIHDNLIQLQAARYGIAFRGEEFLEIHNNLINLFNPPALPDLSIGMYLENPTEIWITCNQVNGLFGGAGTNKRAIHCTRIDYGSIQCNSLNETRYGLQLYDNNPHIRIRGNNFGRHYFGLLLGAEPNDGNAIIPKQFYHDNAWPINVLSGGAQAAHLGTQFAIEQSQFWVDSGDNPYFLPTPVYTPNLPANSGINWFNNNPASQNFTCPICPPLPGGEPGLAEAWTPNDLDLRIASGTYHSDSYLGSMTWKAESELYKRLRQNAGWAMPGTPWDGFMPAKASTTGPRFGAVRTAIETMLKMPPATAAQLEQNVDTTRAKMQRLNEVRIALFQDGQNAVLEAEKTALRQHLLTLHQQRESIYEAFRASVATQATLIKTENEAIATSEVYEENTKSINRIHLEMLISGNPEPDSLQRATLTAIAWQCPLSGGDAVYEARAMLAMPDWIDDPAICRFERSDQRSGANRPAAGLPGLSVYPNPARETLTVAFDAEVENGTLLLSDVFGREAKLVKTGQARTCQIDVRQLPAGIYYLTLLGGPKPLRSAKVFILK